MKFQKKGETLTNNCMVIESKKECEEVFEALQVLKDLQDGKLLKHIRSEVEV